MTKQEFHLKYRQHLLGFYAECFVTRKCTPSEFGIAIDRQFINLNMLLDKMYGDLVREPLLPVNNGEAERKNR